MADLSSVIRLHKHELDEKQRQLGKLYDALSQMEEMKDNLLTQREEEVRLSNTEADQVSYTIAGFLEKSKQEEADLDRHMFILRQEIEIVRDDMLDSFAELKKFELTQEERLRLEEKERSLKEGKMFDEIALQGFRRQQDDK